MPDPADPTPGHPTQAPDGAADYHHGPGDEELQQLINAAAVQAAKEQLPHQAVQLARLDYVAQGPDGPADLYAMFISWFISWQSVIDDIASGLDPGTYWRLVQKHMLLPDHGADPQARRLVGAFLLRVLDEALIEHIDADIAMPTESTDHIEFFYRNIFLGGAGVHRECALILLFMIKYALYLNYGPGALAGGPPADAGHAGSHAAPSG